MSWKEEIKKEKTTTVKDRGNLGELLELAGNSVKTIEDNSEKSFELNMEMRTQLGFFMKEAYGKSPDKFRHMIKPIEELEDMSRKLHDSLAKVTEITEDMEKVLNKLGKAKRFS